MEVRHLNTSLQDRVNLLPNKGNLERIKPTNQTLTYLLWFPSIAIAQSLRSTVGVIQIVKAIAAADAKEWVGFSQIRGLC